MLRTFSRHFVSVDSSVFLRCCLASAGLPDTGEPGTSGRDEDNETVINVDGRIGPIKKQEIRKLFNQGKLTLSTRFWADGLTKPKPLWSIRELR